MNVDKVDFDLDNGKILWSKPITLGQQVLTNNSDAGRDLNFSAQKAATNSCTFEYGSGFPVNVDMDLHCA